MIGLLRVATITPRRARRGPHTRGLVNRLRGREAPASGARRPENLTLRDRLEIADLITEYAWLVDHGHWQEVPALFTETAVLTVSRQTISGREAIATWAAERAARATSRTQQQITNVRVRPAGPGCATATATLVVHVALTGRRSTHAELVAELQDELVMTAEGWRITTSRIWSTDSSTSPTRRAISASCRPAGSSPRPNFATSPSSITTTTRRSSPSILELAGAWASPASFAHPDPDAAELALTVIDDWRGRGVGTRLASQLASRAREEVISIFTALVLADNEAMLALANELGEVRVLRHEAGAVEIAIEL